MADNRFKQGFKDSVIADIGLFDNKIRDIKTHRPELYVLPDTKSGKDMLELHGEDNSSGKSILSTNNRLFNINNNMGKSMVAVNLGLFLYSLFALIQPKETPELINYGALGIMVLMMFAYIYYIHKTHREERKEWRESMEELHKEATTSIKEQTSVLRELHGLIQTINAKV